MNRNSPGFFAFRSTDRAVGMTRGHEPRAPPGMDPAGHLHDALTALCGSDPANAPSGGVCNGAQTRL